MAKVITSPVKKWPGTVTLVDPLTFPQLIAFEQASEAAKAVLAREGTQGEYDAAFIPGLLACVAVWELAGLPAIVTFETFPTRPRKASTQLMLWLAGEIGSYIREDDDLPPA